MYFDSDQFWRNKSSRSCEGFNRDRGPPRHARGVIVLELFYRLRYVCCEKNRC